MNVQKTQSDDSLERFETNESKQGPFNFAEVHIIGSENMYHIDQDFYISKIEKIPSEAELSKFTFTRMKIAWLASKKPDTVF